MVGRGRPPGGPSWAILSHGPPGKLPLQNPPCLFPPFPPRFAPRARFPKVNPCPIGIPPGPFPSARTECAIFPTAGLALTNGSFRGRMPPRFCKGRLAQLVRARASHARGHWFKSSNAHQIFSIFPNVFAGFHGPRFFVPDQLFPLKTVMPPPLVVVHFLPKNEEDTTASALPPCRQRGDTP